MMLVFLGVMNYLIDSYTVFAASVLAANSIIRSLFGAAFPLFTVPMFRNIGIHWGVAVPGFLAFACLPFPFLFYKYGAPIRARCKYTKEAEQILASMMARNPEKQQEGEKQSAPAAEEEEEPPLTAEEREEEREMQEREDRHRHADVDAEPVSRRASSEGTLADRPLDGQNKQRKPSA